MVGGGHAGFYPVRGIIGVTAGVVTCELAVPGVVERVIGMKHVEEAVVIRDRLLIALYRASTPTPGRCVILGHDVVPLASAQDPRHAFITAGEPSVHPPTRLEHARST